MLGMAVDITERRQAEESLRLFRKLIDESNDAIEVVDPKTLRFLDVNDKCCRDLGYTRDELLSLRVFDIDPNATETSVARVGKELEQFGFVTFESVHRRKDGSTYPVEINLKRVELDRPTPSTWFAILPNASGSRRRYGKKTKHSRKPSVWPE